MVRRKSKGEAFVGFLGGVGLDWVVDESGKVIERKNLNVLLQMK